MGSSAQLGTFEGAASPQRCKRHAHQPAQGPRGRARAAGGGGTTAAAAAAARSAEVLHVLHPPAAA